MELMSWWPVLKEPLVGLVAILLLSIVVQAALFGGNPGTLKRLLCIAFSAMITIGMAGFNQECSGLANRFNRPFGNPPDSHVVLGFLGAAAVLAVLVLIVGLVSKPRSEPLSEIQHTSLPKWIGRIGTIVLTFFGAATLVNWAFNTPTYDADCLGALMLDGKSGALMQAIRTESPEDFARLIAQITKDIGEGGRTDPVIHRVIDQRLRKYRAEFTPFMGLLPDTFAVTYLQGLAEIDGGLSPEACLKYYDFGADGLGPADADRIITLANANDHLAITALYDVRRSTAYELPPVPHATHAQWRALNRAMRAAGLSSADLDILYKRGSDDPQYCSVHAIYLQTLATLAAPHAKELRLAVVAAILGLTEVVTDP